MRQAASFPRVALAVSGPVPGLQETWGGSDAMNLGGTFGAAVREIRIGPVYLGKLRECKFVNRETGDIRLFLAEEEPLRRAAGADGVPVVYRTVTYGQEPS
jgi:hypothetical protein